MARRRTARRSNRKIRRTRRVKEEVKEEKPVRRTGRRRGRTVRGRRRTARRGRTVRGRTARRGRTVRGRTARRGRRGRTVRIGVRGGRARAPEGGASPPTLVERIVGQRKDVLEFYDEGWDDEHWRALRYLGDLEAQLRADEDGKWPEALPSPEDWRITLQNARDAKEFGIVRT